MAELREALEEAFTEHEPSAADTSGQELPASPSEPTEQAAPDGASSTPAPTDTATPETPAEKAARERDALGRFTKGDQPDGKGAKPKYTATVAQQPGAQPGAQTYEKPPRDMPVQLRSHWSGLAPEWRSHISQVHQKVAEQEQQYAPIVGFAQRFAQAIAPYQQAIQIEANGDPVAATAALMDTAVRLRYGTPVEKAQLLANVVKLYGVDIQALDSALAGVVPPPGQQQQGINPQMVQQVVQQQLAPLVQQVQARRQAEYQQVAGQVQTELQKFAADPKHEFFNDVRNLMADAMEVAERNGRELSLEDAYKYACQLHPEVSKVMLSRQTGQSAQSLTQAAQRAKAAAVSVKGAAPVGSPDAAAPTSVRDAIENAIEAHSRV